MKPHVITFAYNVSLDFLLMAPQCYVSFLINLIPYIQTQERIPDLGQKRPEVVPHNHFLKPCGKKITVLIDISSDVSVIVKHGGWAYDDHGPIFCD